MVEVFHLHLVRLLAAGRDRSSFVVQGGCNLRFFFGSVRYSEDLDLDVHRVPQDALKERVETALVSKTFRETLLAAGIEVDRTTAPKPTTVQRWKLALRSRGRETAVPTRIEFSRRDGEGETSHDAVDPRLVRRHGLMPVLATHYLLPAAIRQRVGALVGRREVQARDVFDLSLLFSRAGENLGPFADLAPKVPAAIERAWEVSWSDNRGQVVASGDRRAPGGPRRRVPPRATCPQGRSCRVAARNRAGPRTGGRGFGAPLRTDAG